MEGELKSAIQDKIIQGLAIELPAFTRRDVYLPAFRGKALAVIGMRRPDKTTFLWQCMADQLSGQCDQSVAKR